MTAKDAHAQIAALLIDWCDALVRLQIQQPETMRLDGAIMCPACGSVHGRCHEAVYPLLCAARLTGNSTYLDAAKRLFVWGEQMQCADGSCRNDFKSDWKGVTAFAAIALHDALFFHGDLLCTKERAAWEERLSAMGKWLYESLTLQMPAYLNYYAAAACALALLGSYFSNGTYHTRAKELATYCMKHISENGLLFGEGRPNAAVSPKGCRAIDVGGYNVEETLPCLCRYAQATDDRAMLGDCRSLWRAHLRWMLPDGAWDNSTGTRAFKWTYWGSRTADGCQAALFALGKDDPVFAEAAWRNFELYRACTQDGLLCGGPDYQKHGEPACVHHTFCHAKVLAGAIDSGISAFTRAALPSDHPDPVRYYPELDSYQLASGGWRMTVCGYDFAYRGQKHISGGCVTLLWQTDAGALLAAGMADRTLLEPHNQQLPVRPETWRSGCPRLETVDGTPVYGQQFCDFAVLTAQKSANGPTLHAEGCLCSKDGRSLPGGAYTITYRLSDEGLFISGSVDPALVGRVCFILPLIGDKASVELSKGSLLSSPEQCFNLCPGFQCSEYRIAPDRTGRFRFRIAADV